ncbi:MAG: Ig-like domain-containing protein [Gemmatimonadaceae bacterium]|nr:Ig-like domain-containing protein [Gemmatimonadaceae bacterium]MDQ3520627.1 Ig-like domain-containing protein [Gemmatimonadota bacterium]
MRRLLILAAALGCASQGFPPGGPEDKAAPALLSTSPDSGLVNTRPSKWAVFKFDEVISERPQGAATLDMLVLISPRDGAPRVDWRRSSIAVRPRRDWKSNTAYTITILPGISDLRNNVRRERSTIIFGTGAVIPATSISGVVFNWVEGRPAVAAIVEAIAADSTTYVAVADSTGRFALLHVTPGVYRLRGFLDANSNRALDEREAWDSSTVTVSDSVRSDIYAFQHDTVGPRISTVDARDSLTLRVTFDKPIDSRQTIDIAMFSLKGADSLAVPIVLARPALEYERARADSAAALDSAARARDPISRARQPLPGARQAAADSVAANLPKLTRPVPTSEVILQVFPPLRAGAFYRLTAQGVRGLLGATQTSERSLTVPKAPVAPPTPADSLRQAQPPARPPIL